jgi:hypothetical protein
MTDYRPDRLAHLSLYDGLEGGHGCARLADADCLSNLTSLALPYSLDDAAAEALARSAKLGRLVRLDASHGDVTVRGLRSLIESPRLPSLRELNCLHVRLGGPGDGEALAALPGLSRLRSLSLDCCYLPAEGTLALIRSPHLRGVVRLGLWNDHVGDDGVRALVEAPWLAGLRELNLNHDGLTDAAAVALANCPALSRLRVLELNYNNGITDAGAAALADSPHLGRLLRLGLDGARCGRAVRDRLRERFGATVVRF